MSPNYQAAIVGAARVLDSIEKLAQNPRPHGCKQLQGEENLFRVRIGDYRVIYEIRDAVLFVYVLTIAHRREVYR